MTTRTVYVSAAIAFVIISLLFLIVIVQSSVDEHQIIATPNIPRGSGVLTAFASTQVKGNVDEVFAVIKNYNGYSDWSPYSNYKWNDVDENGVPHVGSTGSFKLNIVDFPERVVPVRLTMLDHESRRVADMSTTYPKWLLFSERVQEVVPIEGKPGFCEYRTWQTLEGIGAYYLLLTAREDLSESQQKCATELKAFVEQRKR
ncbi:uncharacterized protein PAC_00522 [Phialocephala subalpina]|uniref:Uncharacterized protein n=1 Tax=Phialocephala subalpina TaxID=576137 RepID=A0A1L7WD42_9HELO|nr:uncharacterized protein PAC_00522 [Phialocephala subalpina]